MKVISLKKEQILAVIYLVIILIGVVKIYNDETVSAFSMPLSRKVIMIDAGHGGFDPGMIGDAKTLEKDINLAIAKKLQNYLELGGAFVVMTRVEDRALGAKKAADMKNRQLIANNGKSDILVSIHQNSYPDGSVKGAQVFYYDNSENSKKLADSIQTEINSFANIGNKKQPEPNKNYFILKRTTIPSVIVECGFLTNYAEKKKLSTDEYQDKMAWAIYMGIIKYYGLE